MEKIPRQESQEIAELKRKSLSLRALAFAKGTKIDVMRPETWNENQGVIVYADKEGEIFAVPSSEDTRKTLSGNFDKDTTVGVLSLNQGECWGDEARRESMTAFKEWQELVAASEREN
jgi:aspartokinase